MTRDPAAALPPAEAVWSVADITGAARQVIEAGMDAVWVRGEVSGFKAYASGHWYFGLKDARAQVRCVMWKGAALKAGRPPADGADVYAFVEPGIWEDKGEFRLTVQRLLATDAIGADQRERERVRAALAADGLLDPARKRPLPPYPDVVALVTSPDGAALRDMVTVTRARWPATRLVLVPARVQGAEAVGELVAALRLVDRIPGVACCVIGRGGGSRDDLAAFDAEAVCRALAAVRVPTVAAIGHETDISLCDLVADVRAATPSNAMELILPDRADAMRHAAQLGRRLAGALRRRTLVADERLRRAGDRLESGMRRLVERARARVDRAAASLDALSPLRVLDRGYAVALAEGRVLRRTAELPPGRAFTVRLSDGEVPCRAEGTP